MSARTAHEHLAKQVSSRFDVQQAKAIEDTYAAPHAFIRSMQAAIAVSYEHLVEEHGEIQPYYVKQFETLSDSLASLRQIIERNAIFFDEDTYKLVLESYRKGKELTFVYGNVEDRSADKGVPTLASRGPMNFNRTRELLGTRMNDELEPFREKLVTEFRRMLRGASHGTRRPSV